MPEGEERICADCGQIVQRTKATGHWGVRKGPSVFSMVCRGEIEDGKLISADYHYVKGEVQRHFPERPS